MAASMLHFGDDGHPGRLAEDPAGLRDPLIHSTQQLSVSAQHFAAFYLLSRGIIKTVLIVGLLRERVHGRGRA
jgi:uncharacterized membrane protein